MERDELIAELEAIMPIVNKWERLSNLMAQNQRSINELNFNIRHYGNGLYKHPMLFLL